MSADLPPPANTSEWLYCWQVWDPPTNTWNIIGMLTQDGPMPMITSRAKVAAGLSEHAHSHAMAARQPIRLVTLIPGAILDTYSPPYVENGDDDDVEERPNL